MTTDTAAPVSEDVRASLVQRLRAMHELFRRAVADLTVAHADHYERAGVLPIAFSLSHGVTSEDRSVGRLFGVPLLWDAHASKVGLSGGVPFRGTAIADAERVRIADMDAWRAYQHAVHARTEEVVAAAPVGQLGGTFETQLDDAAFLTMLVGRGPVRVIDCVEAWVYQHGIRHVGELEHARALVGLGGVS